MLRSIDTVATRADHSLSCPKKSFGKTSHESLLNLVISLPQPMHHTCNMATTAAAFLAVAKLHTIPMIQYLALEDILNISPSFILLQDTLSNTVISVIPPLGQVDNAVFHL
jgi:hypothetical protein